MFNTCLLCSVLVGEGAELWARQQGIATCNHDNLITGQSNLVSKDRREEGIEGGREGGGREGEGGREREGGRGKEGERGREGRMSRCVVSVLWTGEE